MSDALAAAMAALEAALAEETAALSAGDLRGAAARAGAKQAAVERFAAARAGATAAPRLALPLDRLRGAAEANRAALERAIALQGRVIETIARAARRAEAAAQPGYAGAAKPAGPLALSLRA